MHCAANVMSHDASQHARDGDSGTCRNCSMLVREWHAPVPRGIQTDKCIKGDGGQQISEHCETETVGCCKCETEQHCETLETDRLRESRIVKLCRAVHRRIADCVQGRSSMKRMQQRDTDSERERSKETSAPASKRERSSVSSPTAVASASQSPSSTSVSRELEREQDRDRPREDRERERERERERDRLRPLRGTRYRDRRNVDYYRDYHYWHYYDSESEPESSTDKTKRLADQMTIKAGKLNNNQVYKSEQQQMPSRLLLVASLPQAAPEVAAAHGWSQSDHSVNVYVREDDPFTFHRQPIAQSTDSIRTKQGYSRGIHVFQIWWSRRQRGTHALVGVGTQNADTHCVGYQALVGANRESWGWDIGRLRLQHDAQRPASAANGAPQNNSDTNTSHFASTRERERERERERDRPRSAHDSQSGSDSNESQSNGSNSNSPAETNGNGNVTKTENVNMHNKPYPACWTGSSMSTSGDTAAVPERFFMVLDCDEGTLSFVANDQFLGVAFRGLRGRTLYPMISAVWGHGEVTMRYYNGIDEPLSLRDLCRYSLRQHFGNEQLGLMDRLPLPKPIIDYLLYRKPPVIPRCLPSSSLVANSPVPSPLLLNDDSNGSYA